MTMIAPQLSCLLEGRGSGKWEIKARETKRNSDVRRGRSHKSLTLRGVGCEGQEKTWTMVWGSTLQEGQRGLGDSPILSR